MSKYIRTKDGVYKTIREILDGEAYEVSVPQSRWDYDEDNHCYWEDSKIDGFNKKDVIKEADTIDELCDVFICESNEEENDFYVIYPNICSMMKSDFFIKYYEHYNFYAGIQVKGKGIIYVAKVTSKGGLISYELR